MTADELYALLASEVKALSSRFTAGDYENAVNDAQRETWILPQTDGFKILWLKNRAKRYLYSYLRECMLQNILMRRSPTQFIKQKTA